MHLEATLLKLLKLIVADIRKSIIGVIVVGLIAAAGGLNLLSKTVLNFSTQLLSMPTPLWASIALVLLCCVYTYLKPLQYLKKNIPSNTPTIKLIEIGNFKWKTSIYKNGSFEVHPIPYCREHELKLVSQSIGYFCPAIQLGCKSQIMKKDIKVQYDTATSIIEGMINKSLKC